MGKLSRFLRSKKGSAARKRIKEAEDIVLATEQETVNIGCGLPRRGSWASFTSLRPDEWKAAVKKYKKRWSSNRRHVFGKLKNEDQIFTDVILGRALGSGASGTVYIADLYGSPVAVKIVNTQLDTPREIPEVFVSRISHQNLLQILAVRNNVDTSQVSGKEESIVSLSWDSLSSGSFSELAKGIPSKEGEIYPTQETWIMMEYCDLGSLQDGLHDRRFHHEGDLNRPKVGHILTIANQVADAMACLHRSGIVHGDLKAQNIFIKTAPDSQIGFVAKVGDFGASRKVKKRECIRSNHWGTVDHMPPEVLRDGEIRTATDVFSFGMILLELITARRPFGRKTSAAILVAIVEGVRPEIPQHVPSPYAELIQDCWNQEWQLRPEFKDIHRRINAMLVQAELWEMHISDRLK